MELGGGGVGDSRPRISTMEKDFIPSIDDLCEGAAAGGAVAVAGGGLGDASRDSAAILSRFRGRKYSSPLVLRWFIASVCSGGGLGAPTDISEPAGLAGGGLVHNILGEIVIIHPIYSAIILVCTALVK